MKQDQLPARLNNISKILESVVNDFEVNFCSKKEKIIPVSISLSEIGLNKQNDLGYILVARDISTRKQVEDDLKNAFNKLDDLVKERTKRLTIINEKLLISEQTASENEKKVGYALIYILEKGFLNLIS